MSYAVDFLARTGDAADLEGEGRRFRGALLAQQELRRYRTQSWSVPGRGTDHCAHSRSTASGGVQLPGLERPSAPLLAFDSLSEALLTDYGGKLDSRAKDYRELNAGASLRMGDVFDGLQSLSA